MQLVRRNHKHFGHLHKTAVERGGKLIPLYNVKPILEALLEKGWKKHKIDFKTFPDKWQGLPIVLAQRA